MELLTAWGLPAADQGTQASILEKMAERHGLLLPSSRSPVAHYCSVTNPPRFKGRDGDPTSAGGSAVALHLQPCYEITTKLHQRGRSGKAPEQVTFKENPEEVREQAEQRASKGGNRSGKPRGENQAGR